MGIYCQRTSHNESERNGEERNNKTVEERKSNSKQELVSDISAAMKP